MSTHVIPHRTDPFVQALQRVQASEHNGGNIHFGAPRETPHNGIDLGVSVNTPLQVPADKVILIGTTREDSTAGQSMGNAIILFVPDPVTPYFLALIHLSPKTFDHLHHANISIGTELTSESGLNNIIAYTGSSAIRNSAPHLHVTVATDFTFGGRNYTASEFMKMHTNRELSAFLQKKNFYAFVPSAHIRDPSSLVGYLDPTELIKNGSLRFSTEPRPRLLSKDDHVPSQLIRQRTD